MPIRRVPSFARLGRLPERKELECPRNHDSKRCAAAEALYQPRTSGTNSRSSRDNRIARCGIAIGDLDNDGEMEIVVVNLFEPPSLLKNFGSKGNSLLIRAVTSSSRDAVGARISLTTGARQQIDEVRSGGYHVSQGDFRVHFGLGKETKADIAIRWPDGKTDTFPNIGANQRIVIRQGKGVVESRGFEKPILTH